MYRTPGRNQIDPAQGKLAVLLPGMGAVATTFIAGVEAVRKGIAVPVGSLTQLGMLSGEEGSPGGNIPIGEAVSLAQLDDLVFGGWDIAGGDCYEAAREAGVLHAAHLEAVRDFLTGIEPMPAVFDQQFVRNLRGTRVKSGPTKMALAEMLIEDIQTFLSDNGCNRAVAVWCGSTEVYVELEEVHQTIAAFEKGLRENHPRISPAMIYAYALVRAGVPYANGAPNRAVDCPAIVELAEREGVAIAGKDFKTGQTLMKTILAPGFSKRMLGVAGWYSTNILGNRDGVVLDDPGSFRTKEETKLSVLDSILDRDDHPELYADMVHKVRIDYYKPRGDDKEGWDNIDIFGWLGYPMQIKVNFLCKDSILAAPLVLDLALFMDLAQRSGRSGVQEWLSFYFKCPQAGDLQHVEHDIFVQHRMLEQTLREFAAMNAADALANIHSLNG